MVAKNQVADIAAQIGSELMPDNKVWTNRFTVKSTSSSATYVVAQRRSDGIWGCGCPGWRHHKRCKHVKDILQRLAKLVSVVEQAGKAQSYDPPVLSMLQSARAAYLDITVTPIPVEALRTRRILDL